MSPRGKKPKICVDCGGEFKGVNRKKRCRACAMAALRANYKMMGEKRGPTYDRWRKNYIAGTKRHLAKMEAGINARS